MVIFLLLIWLPLVASIESIHSLSEISLEAGSETLALFDIDDTLTILHEPAFQRLSFKLDHAEAFATLMAPLSPEEKALAFTLPLLLTQGDLIDPKTPALIRHLQDQGVKTVALTAAPAGSIDEEFIEERRIAELKRVGIDFSLSFPEKPEIGFPDFPEPLFGTHPLYKQGIIFTNDNNKGEVLIKFLSTLSWKPVEVLFVDDRLEHVIAVEKALTLFDPSISFKGFHYQPPPAAYTPTDEKNFIKKWTECIERAKALQEA